MNSTQHPLVAAYLDDLSQMLGDLPADERSEVLAGVREHIEGTVVERPDVDVRAVLAELGPPDAVAREAYGPGSYAGGSPRPVQSGKPPLSDRTWVPVVVAVLQALCLLVLVVVVGGTASYTTFESSDGVRTVNYSAGTVLVAALAGVLTALPFWIGVALLAGNSSLWPARQKLLHILLLPSSAVLVGLAPELGLLIAGERGLNVASVAAFVLVLLGGAWLVVRLTRAGRAAAHG